MAESRIIAPIPATPRSQEPSDGKLPLWAHLEGCDFIRGSRLINQTLNAPNLALSRREVACLQTLWREVSPLTVGTPIGRTAQIHECRMLHEAAWPFGVFAWQRILCQWNQSMFPALEPGILMTQACSLAAMGSKCPAH